VRLGSCDTLPVFYIGEVVYRGEVHGGEHEPIVERELFEAVQAKLAGNAVARTARLKDSDRSHLRHGREPPAA